MMSSGCSHPYMYLSRSRSAVCTSCRMASQMDMTAMAMAAVLCALVILRIIIIGG